MEKIINLKGFRYLVLYIFENKCGGQDDRKNFKIFISNLRRPEPPGVFKS